MFSRAVRNHVAEHAPAHVFVHAGVVAAGRVGIVVPGISLSGKTTLVVELVRAGALYYSDEYAAVDGDGLIHPYAQAPSIRIDPRTGGREVTLARPQVGSDPVSAGLIVFTEYRQGCQWHPVIRPPSEGALALLEHTVSLRSKPEAALSAARRLAAGATVLSGARGEASETALAVLDRARAMSSASGSDIEHSRGVDRSHSRR